MQLSSERLMFLGLLAATLTVRAIEADQPIVENYVGRQTPTAMVARNLDRGSGFLRPELDTGPFPNLFLVEPPIYASAVVGLRRATGLGLEPAGRLVSALATALGAWGLFGLARRREGPAVALLALAAFAAFPITIRYGRAFQPDALMLGTQLAGLRCWDEHEGGRGWPRLVSGWVLLATSLAIKIISAYILIPLLFAIVRPRRAWKVALAVAMLAPALLWYGHAWALLSEGAGSRASADNAWVWLRVLGGDGLRRRETFALAGRYLFVRGFTPMGFSLAAWGSTRVRGSERLWWVWAISAGMALLALAGKVHHEYYWLVVAPLVAIGVARGLVDIAGRGVRGRSAAVAIGLGMVLLAAAQSRSTWRSPAEWVHLPEAARAIREVVPTGPWVVAPEPLLFASDRRGCRLEFGRKASEKAGGEWGGQLGPDGPLALVEFYRMRGARYFADVGPGLDDPRRRALHEAIRRRYAPIIDRPGVLVALLNDPKGRNSWRPQNPP